MRRRLPSIGAVLIAGLALAGCTSNPKGKFECPYTGGVACMSMTDMYEATHNTDHVVGKGAPRAMNDAGRDGSGVQVQGDTLTFAERTPVASLPTQLPVRLPAKVMRIWIAPWVDAGGDLNLAGHVFTEIESRKWSVGERGVDTVPTFSPLQVGAAPVTEKTASD